MAKTRESGSQSRGGSNLEDMSKDELMEMAREREISGRSSMNKEELIQALGKSEGKGRGGRNNDNND